MTTLAQHLNPALRQKFSRLGTGEIYRQAIRDINNATIPRIKTHYNKRHQLVKIVVSVFYKGEWLDSEYQPVYDDGKLTLFYIGSYFEELTIEEFVDRYSHKEDN